MVVIDCHDGVLEATALPRPIVVPADVIGDALATPVPGDARGRLELHQRGEAPSVCEVRACVVVSHGDRPHAMVEDIDTIDVLPIVLGACFVTHDGAALRARLPTAVALSRVPALRVAHGTDVATRLEDGAAALQCALEHLTRLGVEARSQRS